ncbi:copper-binding protein [Propionivibrio limicola]|uniref:copper-binding protein n=1 Tax=Propionivibrio limicola TaxID=167645 RepID=UPI0012917676|nr:copper-binding protein [Propionivibrio limicola]
MKNTLAISIAALFALLSPAAQSAGGHNTHSGHGAMHSAVEGGMVDGVVKKIDTAAGKVTVSHGPLTNLDMPAMTMVFRVKDATWLDQIQVGSKIRFVADNLNNALTIVRFELAK